YILPTRADLRPLHPFPTRRSSDLAQLANNAETADGLLGASSAFEDRKVWKRNLSRRGLMLTPILFKPLQAALERLPLRQQLVWKDRKSTRLNSSHDQISYAVFCLK